MKEFMFVVGLLLALYGLTCIISTLVMWLTTNENENKAFFVIPVSKEKLIKWKIGYHLERLKNCGVLNSMEIIVLDYGIPNNKLKEIQQYCHKKGVAFYGKEMLLEYLEKTSFQNRENTV